jgi:hypothetical protein
MWCGGAVCYSLDGSPHTRGGVAVSRYKQVHIELDVVLHLWVDIDPGSPPQLECHPDHRAPGDPPEASVTGGQVRGIDLAPGLLVAIAAAYAAEVLDEALSELDHRAQPSLPLGAS